MEKVKNEKSSKIIKSTEGQIENTNPVKTLIILIVTVAAIFLAFYGITLLVDKKNSNSKQEAGVLQETIQYEEILIGEVTNRKEKEYYVLIENSDNKYNDLYITYLKQYVGNIKYYTVDLSNALNSPYVGESTLVSKSNFLNSKFSDTTLIKIKDNKISKIYSTHEDILAILKKLAA